MINVYGNSKWLMIMALAAAMVTGYCYSLMVIVIVYD